MVGRNDPCPCGSGKKYKRCCAGKNEDFLEQQVGQELNRILFGVFENVSKQVKFTEFESYGRKWKEELGKLWDMKSIEETISAYYIFVARQDLWRGYLTDVLNSTLRTKTRAVAETWKSPIVLLGKVVSKEDDEYLKVEELFGDKSYLLKKNEDMVENIDAVVYGIVLPDNGAHQNGIRVVSSLMIVKDKMNSLKAAIQSFVKSNNKEQNPDFIEAHMLDIYAMLLGKPAENPVAIEAVKATEIVEAAVEIETPETAETIDDVETMEDLQKIVESDLTVIQQETIELLKKTLVGQGVELEQQNLLESICVSYFAKEQPNFRKANVVAAGVFRAALDLDLLNEEPMTNSAVAKLFDISPASMSRHAEAVRELIPELV